MFRRRNGSVVVGVALVIGALISGSPAGAAERGGASPAAEPALIPVPSSLETHPDESFLLRRDSRIVIRGDSADVARHFAQLLRPSTGFELPVTDGRPGPGSGPIRNGDIVLRAGSGADTERYRLLVTADRVTLSAVSAEGLFRGVQTLRQLFPPAIEGDAVVPGPWTAPGVKIVDLPRFPWRGAHLDVSRHFFSVDEVKRYIDLLELYKVNVLHLHLSDDQGWRIMIESWPRLATYGGSIEVGGTPGGYYTHEDYEEIVRYAADRYLTVVPEIDTPGHTNAALASYAELNCDGIAPPLYDGIDVGFSSLCIDKEITYEWFDDVVAEIAALTPGPYFHLGGDEAHETSEADYLYYLERAQPIVTDHGKRVMGWVDIAQAPLAPGSIAQYWYPASGSEDGTELARMAADQGAQVVMSPANKAYLDMKYDEDTPLGLSWAGFVEVEDSYDWDPATFVDGVGEQDVMGVEAALWSETLLNVNHIEFMAFPRLAGIAEIGWSPASGRAWAEYRLRLAAQGPRWEAMDVDFYRSPQVPWE